MQHFYLAVADVMKKCAHTIIQTKKTEMFSTAARRRSILQFNVASCYACLHNCEALTASRFQMSTQPDLLWQNMLISGKQTVPRNTEIVRSSHGICTIILCVSMFLLVATRNIHQDKRNGNRQWDNDDPLTPFL